MNEPLFTFADEQGRRQRRFVAIPAEKLDPAAPMPTGNGRSSGRGLLLAGIARWTGRPRTDAVRAAR
ncbi:MAG: hypothetical protein ACXWUR_03150 [Allosphingosinicella sp.]